MGDLERRRSDGVDGDVRTGIGEVVRDRGELDDTARGLDWDAGEVGEVGDEGEIGEVGERGTSDAAELLLKGAR